MQNRCHGRNTTCKPCDERFISCVNKPDGRNEVPGDIYSYVYCLQNRTINRVMCSQGAFFHPLVKECIPLRFFGRFVSRIIIKSKIGLNEPSMISFNLYQIQMTAIPLWITSWTILLLCHFSQEPYLMFFVIQINYYNVYDDMNRTVWSRGFSLYFL